MVAQDMSGALPDALAAIEPRRSAPATDEFVEIDGHGAPETLARAVRVSCDRVVECLIDQIGAAQYERYFKGQAEMRSTASGAEVVVPTDYLAKSIDRRFGPDLRAAVSRAAGVEPGHGPGLAIRVDRAAFTRLESAPLPVVPNPSGRSEARPRATVARSAGSIRGPLGIQPGKYRLDDFVVGKANQLAHAAATRFAEDPASIGSLFIHGMCGLGKTHLLQAIASRYVERHPDANVRYLTAEAFTNDYVAAVRSNRVDAFRKVYRKLDLLCLDDVSFFSSKEGTQSELLHTFDCIGAEGARVVFASDEHPREIKDLTDKLVSRFMSGAVVKLETPDPELRVRLVRKLAQRRGLSLEEAAVRLVAERSAQSAGTLGGFGGSVRELDGLLIQIEAVQKLLPEFSSGHGPIGIVLVSKALGLNETSGAKNRRPIRLEEIVGEVCRALSVETPELMGRGRHKRVVLARAICGHLARKHTTMSFPEIAKGLGRPNHSTVITACKRLDGQLRDPEEGRLVMADDVLLGLAPELRGLALPELVEALSSRVVRVGGRG